MKVFYANTFVASYRISILVALSCLGMLTVALSDTIGFKLFGIIVASLSSGLGELSFLQLTHFYGEISLAAFSSGTGGAGLVGSMSLLYPRFFNTNFLGFAYLAFTTWMGLSVKTTLLLFSVC